MDWNTIYITGREGFKHEVARRLEHSDVNYMPGYMGAEVGKNDHDMYWLDKTLDLRAFKEAIGAKAIWKYRIHFYESQEKFIASQNQNTNPSLFTKRDIALIESMRRTKMRASAA